MTGKWVIAVVVAVFLVGVPGYADGVPEGRVKRLARGINASHWYAQSVVGHYRPEHVDHWMGEPDAKLIRSLGFTYVRLPVEPEVLWNDADPARPDAGRLAQIDAAVRLFLDAGLAVMVDPHPKDEFKDRLKTDPAHLAHFEKFLEAFAAHLSKTDPERVFLEVMNEPVYKDGARWAEVQRGLLAALRRGAPRHTLVATGDMWGSIKGLMELTPYADRNVVYSFHTYDPFNFTHQGASWLPEPMKSLRRVPYPISLEIAEMAVPFQPTEETQGAVWQLGHERWNALKLKATIAPAAEWGRRHGVAVVCTEFGAYHKTLPEHRFNYLRDMRSALESNGIPWAVWDYAGGFGVATGKPGERKPDPMVVEALGLSVAAPPP